MYEPKNDLIELLQLFPDADWDYDKVSCNELITLDFVKSNPDKPWNWYNLSCTIPEKDIKENPDLLWVQTLKPIPVQHDLKSFDFIKKNLNKKWDWYSISKHSMITWEIVEDNPEVPWNWYGLSINKNITYEITRKHPYNPWVFSELSSNPSVTIETILNNTFEQWDWNRISKNPNLTWEYIKLNKPWNFKALSQNTFNYKTRMIRYTSISKIKDLCRNWIHSDQTRDGLFGIKKRLDFNKINTVCEI
jgi:hypothetical protein